MKDEIPYEEKHGYTNPMEESYPANLPIWKSSLAVIVFGLIVKYWSQILTFLNGILV